MRATYKTDECTPKLSEELGRCIEGQLRYVDSYILSVCSDQEIIARKPLQFSIKRDLCYNYVYD